MKGLHNISLQENMCTARVCEVILYILTTLLDLGLLKSKTREKVKTFSHWLVWWNTYYSFEIFGSYHDVYTTQRSQKITMSFLFFSVSSDSQSPLFFTLLCSIFLQTYSLSKEKLLSWNVDTNIFDRADEMDRGVCRGQERIHCPTITWLWIWLWGEY